MDLRPYQQALINAIYHAWDNGAQNVIAQLSTGGGKTVILSNIIANNKGPAIAIAHRIELVSQISLTLARYGISHRVIAQRSAIKEITSLHLTELNRNFINPNAQVIVAGVDTLIRLPENTPWFKTITLVVQDEGHHPLKENKWGKVAEFFPTAKGLYPTATPTRADGKGLGRHTDGIADAIVIGPEMRDLIKMGYLTEYRIFAPPSALNLNEVPLSANGDFNPVKLREVVHKGHITGDIVKHYLKLASNKLGVTFAVDIAAATEIAAAYREAGVPAEVISSKTPDLLRNNIMRQFRNREILQIVNVDLLGEGVDVPAIEVVSMARPTHSYGLYSQQFGRALRPMPNKTHAIIIDHVENVIRHGLPDAQRIWTLDRREKRTKKSGEILLKTCIKCLAVYERFYRECPHCGHYTEPESRSTIEYVDGDLFELDEKVLALMRGEIERIDDAPYIPKHLPPHAQKAIANRHKERQEAQKQLRNAIANWAGHLKACNKEDSEIYRCFYFSFGIDIMSAQTLNMKDADNLTNRIVKNINEKNL